MHLNKNDSTPGRYKAVMFDLDGTLLDTLEDLADSVNAALTQLGYPAHRLSHFKTAVGDGAEMMISRSLPADARSAETVGRAFEILVDEYSRRWNAKSRPYDGIPEMLDRLEGDGVIKCILSNKPDASTQKVVRHFLSRWNFGVVRGAVPGRPIKPDPSAALEIVDQCGFKPREWLYVGDTDTDMQTAKAAGMFALGVTWGFREAQELRDNGADLVIDHPAEINEICAGLAD